MEKHMFPSPLRSRMKQAVVSLTLVAGAVGLGAPAVAIPPFPPPPELPRLPVQIPRPPRPNRVELAPPHYGYYPTVWKRWPGQNEMLEDAQRRREENRRARERSLEEVLEGLDLEDDEESTEDDVGGPLGPGMTLPPPVPPQGDPGPLGPSGDDSAPPPLEGFDDDALPEDSALPIPPRDNQGPAEDSGEDFSPPTEAELPPVVPLPSDGDTEGGFEENTPGTEENEQTRAQRGSGTRLARTEGAWRAAGTAGRQTTIEQRWVRAATPRSGVVQVNHVEPVAPAPQQPRRLRAPRNAREIPTATPRSRSGSSGWVRRGEPATTSNR